MALNTSDKEWIEGLIVRHHEGRLATTSQLFREFGDILKEHTKRIKQLEDDMRPLTEGIVAGKLSYWFVIKLLGFISLLGGVIILIKQALK
jgi:hypothetical protein